MEVIQNKCEIFNINKGVKPKILYTSCHEILEYDELRMLTDVGYTVFSIGNYTNPSTQGQWRTPQANFFNAELYAKFLDSAGKITPKFLSSFDAAIVMHDINQVKQIVSNSPKIPIIYRSIGQGNPESEAELKPFEDRIIVVRYSEKECNIEGLLQENAVIYFGKYHEDFKPWSGGERLMSFHNLYPQRSSASVPNLEFYKEITEKFPSSIGGAGNEALLNNLGLIHPKDQNSFYENCSLYFYIHSIPPSYTLNFVEALGSGAPIVAPSATFLENSFSSDFLRQTGFPISRYEIDDFLQHDEALLYNSLDDAINKIRWLLDNPRYREEISAQERLTFSKYFDAKNISLQWDELLMSLG